MRLSIPKAPKGYRWLNPNEVIKPTTDLYHSEDTGKWARFEYYIEGIEIYAYHYAIRKIKTK